MISRTEVQSSALSLQRRFERWFEGCTHFRVQTGQTSQSTSPRSWDRNTFLVRACSPPWQRPYVQDINMFFCCVKRVRLVRDGTPFQPPNMPGLSPPLGVLRFIKFSINLISVQFFSDENCPSWRKKQESPVCYLSPKMSDSEAPYPWIGKPPGGWDIWAPKPPTLLRKSIGWLRRMFWESFLDFLDKQKHANRGTSWDIHISSQWSQIFHANTLHTFPVTTTQMLFLNSVQ